MGDGSLQPTPNLEAVTSSLNAMQIQDTPMDINNPIKVKGTSILIKFIKISKVAFTSSSSHNTHTEINMRNTQTNVDTM